jgi:ribosomal protein S27E
MKLENHTKCPICNNIAIPSFKQSANASMCQNCGSIITREGKIELVGKNSKGV